MPKSDVSAHPHIARNEKILYTASNKHKGGRLLTVRCEQYAETKNMTLDHEEETLSNGSPADQAAKIQSLREMIQNAERTIQGARSILLSLEGKKKTGRPRKIADEEEGTVIQGAFDGQFMLGSDGKQYPVPANYASKSKLVQGDMLKLTITNDGSFIYKQIGPAERKNAIGIVVQDDRGNYLIAAEGRPYRILLASVTYFKLSPGDEVAIVLPRDVETAWAAVENVLQKASSVSEAAITAAKEAITVKTDMEHWKEELKPAEETSPIEEEESAPVEEAKEDAKAEKVKDSLLDDWIKDMEELEKEMEKQKQEEAQKS
jgi:hypothetical protein